MSGYGLLLVAVLCTVDKAIILKILVQTINLHPSKKSGKLNRYNP